MLIHEVKDSLRSLAPARNPSVTQWRQETLAGLEKATIVKADNIAEYVYENADSLKSWPKATPFSEFTWVEWVAPDDAEFVDKYGVLVYCCENPDKDTWEARGRWVVASSSFIKGSKSGRGKGQVVGLPLMCAAYLRPDGSWPKDRFQWLDIQTLKPIEVEHIDENTHQDFMCTAYPLLVALTLFNFTHCRNVEKIEHTEPWYKKSTRTLLNVYGGEVKYHTIQIEPVKKKAADPAPATEGDKGNRAMHICRGHFKTFEPGHGLFGKYVGQYWWGQQIRGNKAAGTVISDYSTKKLAAH